MKRLLLSIFAASQLFFLWVPQAFADLALNNCNANNVCTVLTATNLPADNSGIDQNVTVHLSFVLYKKADQSSPACSTGRQLYHAVWHQIGNDSKNYDYQAYGAGNVINYDFNSLNAGNKNKYYGIFYCWSKQFNDKMGVEAALSQASRDGEGWQTQTFDLDTRNGAIAGPEVVPNSYSAKMGDTITLLLKNPPPGNWTGRIAVGDHSAVETNKASTNLIVTTENGFKDNSKNNIVFTLYDANDNPLTLKNDGIISIVVGTIGGGGDGTGTPVPPKVPDKLYNPLPEEELTHVFLMILQGFMTIIGIWAVIFIVVGGFQMVMSAGNEEGIAKAKKTITWAVLGLVIALLSFSIVAIVQNLLKANIKPASLNSNYANTQNKGSSQQS